MFTIILDILFGPVCPVCEKRSRTIKVVREFSNLYHDESMNWFTGCESCRKLNDFYCCDVLSERLHDKGIL
jgi:hypothetical protein